MTGSGLPLTTGEAAERVGDNPAAMLGADEFLRFCVNPECERAVEANFLGQRQSEYCCSACAQAHDGGYEIHEAGPLAHSPGCDERWETRRHREIRYGR